MEYWEYQIPDLSRDHRCLAYNRRGHAKIQWTDYGFSLHNQTRDLEQLIARLGIERPAFITLAFGTTIAANCAIRNPDKVRGIVLGAWTEFAGHPLGEYQRGMLEFGLSVPNLVSEFKKLETPVLGVCGDRDPYPDQPEVLHGMANFREAPQIRDGGRFVNWERPQEFNATIRSFLQSLP